MPRARERPCMVDRWHPKTRGHAKDQFRTAADNQIGKILLTMLARFGLRLQI